MPTWSMPVRDPLLSNSTRSPGRASARRPSTGSGRCAPGPCSARPRQLLHVGADVGSRGRGGAAAGPAGDEVVHGLLLGSPLGDEECFGVSVLQPLEPAGALRGGG